MELELVNMSDVSFEGEEVGALVAQLPSTKIENLGAAYPIGTMMTLEIQVRVKSVRIDEDRKGNLARAHMLNVEDVALTDVLTPAQRRALIDRLERGDLLSDGITPGQIGIDEVLAEQAAEQSDQLS